MNQNGRQDTGEKEIEGITIELYRPDGSKVGEQKTDSNGFDLVKKNWNIK
ncbi:SdrD B-like domain-containing protein [Bacillus thuringiensis]|nr:SdrD B-like domain-containing protein [Bacillus thuringiensis]